MQTNFHAQLKSLIAQAIGTLKHQIEVKGLPSQFDSEIKVIPIPPKTYPLNIGSVLEVGLNGLLCSDGEEYPFSAMPAAQLLTLIDEVCQS